MSRPFLLNFKCNTALESIELTLVIKDKNKLCKLKALLAQKLIWAWSHSSRLTFSLQSVLKAAWRYLRALSWVGGKLWCCIPEQLTAGSALSNAQCKPWHQGTLWWGASATALWRLPYQCNLASQKLLWVRDGKAFRRVKSLQSPLCYRMEDPRVCNAPAQKRIGRVLRQITIQTCATGTNQPSSVTYLTFKRSAL